MATKLSKNCSINYSDLISKLIDFGYVKCPIVTCIGEFSVKGNVVDLFTSKQSHPIRIEYDFNVIDRITSFDLSTQLSLSNIDNFTLYPFDGETSFNSITRSPSQTLTDFHVGDYVVHENHGIGKYHGLVRLNNRNMEGEFLKLVYAQDACIYIPLDQISIIHRYADAETTPKLSQLYKGQWNKTKKKVQKYVNLMLEDIYRVYKARQKIKGFVYSEDSAMQLDFEEKFKFKLTKDQERCVNEIKNDMQQGKVIDRLICGDVGFGKTEVMFRGIFKVLEHQQQVLILAPTTLLAYQHYQRCLERFHDFPFNIAHLSRLVSNSEQEIVLKKIEHHQVDLLIGTHRALSSKINFKNLGMLVIDEEQRFGVLHKEKIKKIKNKINVLSLSATPIPRTLYASLTGAKDISKIETPPKTKKAIQTAVLQYDDYKIKEIISKEIHRNGQVFYVFNRVAKIDLKLKQLRLLMPKLNIERVHGQLPPSEIQKKMLQFQKKELDILLTTTIVENGLDIESANTIIIENVERYGLSQLHQLRGRVGRGKEQGYCYMIYDNLDSLSSDAKKRLEAIKAYQVLGSGFDLAMKDLEIRGAGSMFGDQQHGHVYDVGFALYCKMIEEGLSRIQNKNFKAPKSKITLDALPFKLPEDYIENDQERLSFYMTLAKLNNKKELLNFKKNTQDRYGKFPTKVKRMFSFISSSFF